MTSIPRPVLDGKQLRPETRLVHSGAVRSQFGENSEALFLTQGFVYDEAETAEARFSNKEPGFVYSRQGNPTVSMFEQRLASIESAEACRATATGMAAVAASLLCFMKAGDHIVASRALFGSCRWIVEDFLPRYGAICSIVDGTDLRQWEAAIRPETRAFFLESPTNPTLEVLDIAAIARLAKHAEAKLVVDNVFATPLLQSPLEMGADVVVYSATKHIDGQGRCLGGAVLSTAQFVDEHLNDYMRHTGPCLSPFNAWVLLKGLETLAVRVERMQANAVQLAERLGSDKRIRNLKYPWRADHPQAELARRQMKGGGTLLTFEVDGGKAGAFKFCNALRLIRISNNLGDAKTLIAHPATTTHHRFSPEVRAQMGISDGLLRLSVGLEHVEDLGDDILRGLNGG